MPRTALTPINLPGGSAGVGFQQITYTATDSANGNAFTSTGKEIIVAHNTSGSTVRKLTLQKTAGKIEINLGIGEIWCSGQIPTTGYKQASDSKVWIDSASSDIEVAILVLP